ncbi:ABC transporter permease [Croceitalea rosinachiae]|uniref:FtsX-like permease family protein n=1 Tax=Croceitalea rosinachiae TaxID=3075596 RepID=A0ABU3ABR3_9FLAO|nr:ABC transporter permease [Croceitalea sp. F388]MDT0606361.1 FtsX-like permease family protein [Croceitalea sp. F388]
MLKNHIKIALRSLLKNKAYLLTNIFGLSVALTVSFLMLLWVQDERKMDKFHENDNRLFSVKRTIPLGDGTLDVYRSTSYPLLHTAKEQLPEVENYIPLGYSFEDNLRLDNINLRAQGAFASASLFTSFTFPVLMGDISQLDQKSEALVISESLAKRFWGANWKSRAIGSSIDILDNGTFTIEAVYKDFPKSSTIQNDFYYSFNSVLAKGDWMDKWDVNRMAGAFLLKEGADYKKVEDKLEKLFQSHLEGEQKEGILLQKFSDGYLYGKFDEQAEVSGGRIEYVRIFTIAAFFLLLVSCINFVNLSTVHAVKRSNEIGVRKVVGAKRNTLIAQFITETVIITAIAFSIAFVCTILLLPSINGFVEKSLVIDFGQPSIWIALICLFLLTALLSGLYPAMVISSFKPIMALKGKGKEKKNTVSLRKGLVILQFGLTILLIFAAMVVKMQVDFINKKDLGIIKDHVVSIHQDQELTENYEVLRNELIASEGIEDVTLAGPSPINMSASTSGVVWPGKSVEQENVEFALLWGAHNFPKVFKVEITDGTYYREGSMDTLNIVINEQAVAVMGLQNPIGKSIQLWGQPREIIGVLKDFHNQSLYEPIQPAVFLLNPENAGNLFVKIKAKETEKALASLDAVFKRTVPNIPLHYNFMDEQFAASYKTEQLTSTLAYYFAMISILISCLGLFGLATFMAKQRTKEIGIRKVLGASVSSITTLISKDFLKLVLLSIVIAAPLAYYFMDNWLQDFAYKINIRWWVFVLTGALAILIALITIGFQAIKAAIANPVKSLRTE